MESKKFKLTDGKGEDVMGGLLDPTNVYLTAYGHPIEGQKPVVDLEIGEKTILRFSLSGTSGTYYCTRIS